ncbi:MAG TPA: DUF523 domain-containing protein [Myxococcota bacterium]|nr:DUF523 domain-containing protein [Myxococcota bacterium]
MPAIIVDAPRNATVRGVVTADDRRPVRVGISSCLIGQAVRYDGGHKRDRALCAALRRFAEFVPVCPELEAGLGVPRPPMRLVREGERVRLIEIASGRDHTQRLARFTAARVRALRALDLSGYVFKKGSPSCGVARVPLYRTGARRRRSGTGLFARGVREAFPDLPIAEEAELGDPARRAHFAERVLGYARVSALFRGRWTTADVAAFHAAHERQLRAHSRARCRALARIAAGAAAAPRAEVRARYTAGFLAALARPVQKLRIREPR